MMSDGKKSNIRIDHICLCRWLKLVFEASIFDPETTIILFQESCKRKLLSWFKNLARENYYLVSRILREKVIILTDPTVMQEKYYSIGKLKPGFQLYQAPCSPQ